MALAGTCTGKVFTRYSGQLPVVTGVDRFGYASHYAAFSSSFSLSVIKQFWAARRRKVASVRRSVQLPVNASQEASAPTLLVQEVEFTWKGPGSQVFVTGDFLNWETKLSLEKRSSGAFSVKQKLPLGRYAYKFVVDGECKFSPDNPTVPDGAGGLNNEIMVTDVSATDVTKDTGDAPVSQPGLRDTPVLHCVTVVDRQRGVTHQFSVPEDQYILHTGEDQNISLPFSCRHGCCTACAVRVKSGHLYQPEALGISAELKAQGYGLLCVGYALSDLEVETQDEDEVYWLQFGRYFARGPIVKDDYALELAMADE